MVIDEQDGTHLMLVVLIVLIYSYMHSLQKSQGDRLHKNHTVTKAIISNVVLVKIHCCFVVNNKSIVVILFLKYWEVKEKFAKFLVKYIYIYRIRCIYIFCISV